MFWPFTEFSRLKRVEKLLIEQNAQLLLIKTAVLWTDLTHPLLKELRTMSESFDNLVLEVAGLTDVVASADAALDGLAAKVEELLQRPTPEAIQALADDIRAAKAALAASIVENTEAPAPAPEPEVPAELETPAEPEVPAEPEA